MPKPTDKQHEEAEMLLPWYVTGELETADRKRVEEHLSSCSRCQHQLGLDRILVEEFRASDPDLELGWARLRRQIERSEPRAHQRLAALFQDAWRTLSRPAVAGLVAAQLVFIFVAGAVLLRPSPPAYRALGSSASPASANVIVMFRVDSTERDMRHALQAAGASLVGGPTAADAYLIHVQANERSAAVARLRADSSVTMAEPIDGTGS